MSTKTRKKLEKINELIEDLLLLSSSGIPIVVEGKKDIQTLNNLGIFHNIISAKTSGRSFLDLQREIMERGFNEVILLFDFDRRGKEWTKRLSHWLEGMRIIPNVTFWKGLLTLVGRDIKDIEGLFSFIKTIENGDPDVIKYNRH